MKYPYAALFRQKLDNHRKATGGEFSKGAHISKEIEFAIVHPEFFRQLILEKNEEQPVPAWLDDREIQLQGKFEGVWMFRSQDVGKMEILFGHLI